jgi:pleuromutilin/lincosamide/streptogramin A transport system ATP-binding/permease protein
VTHDRDLIESFANRIIELQGGHIRDYPGDLSYYMRKKSGRVTAKTSKVRKKVSKIERLRQSILLKEERRRKLRQSFMRQAGSTNPKKAKRLFEEYQKLTQEIEELERLLSNP